MDAACQPAVTALHTDEILVGGRWRPGTGITMHPGDPTTGKELSTLTAASETDVDEAVHEGHVAANDAEWRELLPHERARHLRRIADGIEEHAGELALLQTRNTGKTLSETNALVSSAAGTFRFYAAALETHESSVTPQRGPELTFTVHEPIGVVAAITPWNSPIASDAQKIAPALAAGNAVIVKPAEWTPLVALAVGRIVTASGLPSGLLSVLPGSGSVVGDALVRHPDVGKVSFTGGTTSGRTIAHHAAEKIMPVTLELGGKSPTIVFDDAEIDHAVAGILFGVFSSSGQSCIAGSRIFVAENIYQQVLTRLVTATRALCVGPGTAEGSQVGPLVTTEHRDRVAAMVEQARAEGGVVRCGGSIPADPELADGAYYLPTIITDLDNSAATCQQEIFGPVAVVLPFRDESDLVELANDTVYGLACGIWTTDYRKAWRVARRIDAGTVWVNTYKRLSIATPFSGVKESGLGTEKGRDGILSYTRQKSVYLGLNEDPLSWAGSV